MITPETLEAIMQADEAIAWARITSAIEIHNMNKHSLDYIDLHPEPVQQDPEPSNWLVWLAAAVALVGLCAALALGFAAGQGLLS